MIQAHDPWPLPLIEFSPNLFLSATGRVWSNKTRKWRKLPCNGAGYLNVSCPEGTFYLHRLIAQHYHGDPPSPKHVAHHKNGIRTDNYPENITWATQRVNKSIKTKPIFLVWDPELGHYMSHEPPIGGNCLVFKYHGGKFEEISQNISLPIIKSPSQSLT